MSADYVSIELVRTQNELGCLEFVKVRCLSTAEEYDGLNI